MPVALLCNIRKLYNLNCLFTFVSAFGVSLRRVHYSHSQNTHYHSRPHCTSISVFLCTLSLQNLPHQYYKLLSGHCRKTRYQHSSTIRLLAPSDAIALPWRIRKRPAYKIYRSFPAHINMLMLGQHHQTASFELRENWSGIIGPILLHQPIMHHHCGSATKTDSGRKAMLDDLTSSGIGVLVDVYVRRFQRVVGKHCSCWIHVELQRPLDS